MILFNSSLFQVLETGEGRFCMNRQLSWIELNQIEKIVGFQMMLLREPTDMGKSTVDDFWEFLRLAVNTDWDYSSRNTVTFTYVIVESLWPTSSVDNNASKWSSYLHSGLIPLEGQKPGASPILVVNRLVSQQLISPGWKLWPESLGYWPHWASKLYFLTPMWHRLEGTKVR